MTVHRKRRLRELIDTRFRGMQKDFAAAARMSEGRVTQILDPDDSFGERSAKKICQELRLEDRYFEQGFLSDTSYVPIARLEVHVGAGDGKVAFSEDVIGGLAFRRDFLREVGITNVDDGVVLNVKGESMGDLFDGSVVLVNKKSIEPMRNRLFVFVRDEGPVLKRVVQVGGAWLARSDNEDKKRFPDFALDHTNTMIGRAVWVGAKL